MFLKPHKKEETDENGNPVNKKHSIISSFHNGFNKQYNKLLNVYRRAVQFLIKTKWIAIGITAASIVLLVLLMKSTATGFVPNEDTGTIMINVNMPPSTSQDRTLAVTNTVDKGEIVAVNDEHFDDKVAAIQKIEEIGASYAIGRDCNGCDNRNVAVLHCIVKRCRIDLLDFAYVTEVNA